MQTWEYLNININCKNMFFVNICFSVFLCILFKEFVFESKALSEKYFYHVSASKNRFKNCSVIIFCCKEITIVSIIHFTMAVICLEIVYLKQGSPFLMIFCCTNNCCLKKIKKVYKWNSTLFLYIVYLLYICS